MKLREERQKCKPTFDSVGDWKRGSRFVAAIGGWVNDSEPEAEFQETVNKSKAMLKAVALAETFGKTPTKA